MNSKIFFFFLCRKGAWGTPSKEDTLRGRKGFCEDFDSCTCIGLCNWEQQSSCSWISTQSKDYFLPWWNKALSYRSHMLKWTVDLCKQSQLGRDWRIWVLLCCSPHEWGNFQCCVRHAKNLVGTWIKQCWSCNMLMFNACLHANLLWFYSFHSFVTFCAELLIVLYSNFCIQLFWFIDLSFNITVHFHFTAYLFLCI